VFAQRFAQLPVLLDAAAALQDLLGVGLVVPEIGRRGLGFYLGKLGVQTSDVKDNSEGRRPSWRGPGSV
jgi:hypothetical protein